jgi:hypothetical protein
MEKDQTRRRPASPDEPVSNSVISWEEFAAKNNIPLEDITPVSPLYSLWVSVRSPLRRPFNLIRVFKKIKL